MFSVIDPAGTDGPVLLPRLPVDPESEPGMQVTPGNDLGKPYVGALKQGHLYS